MNLSFYTNLWDVGVVEDQKRDGGDAEYREGGEGEQERAQVGFSSGFGDCSVERDEGNILDL